MSVHWLTHRFFVLLLALSIGASGVAQAFFIPASSAAAMAGMSMGMAMDMPADQLAAGSNGSDQGVPCKDMPLNCSGGLSCVTCVALPQILLTVRLAEQIEERDWSPRVDGSSLTIRPALPPPIPTV